MKRILFLVVAFIVALSTLDYCATSGHYGLVVVLGVIVAFWLVGKYL